MPKPGQHGGAGIGRNADGETSEGRTRSTRKTREIVVAVHKAMPECCRAALLDFAKHDRYQGGGEPGDKIRCGCGNWLVYGPPGWKVGA